VTQIEKGKSFIFTAEVAVKPEVTLGEYKGVEVTKTEIVVSEEDVDKEVDKEREKNSRMVDIDDRAVENGDMIKLNFEGFVDGEAFAGGKGEDYPLTIGSGSFIPGFEEQLVGAKIGEDVEVNVTFPEEYQAEELKGKAAVFKCKVNAIQVKELPEADDEFAQDVSEFDTLAEYRDDVRAKLVERKEAEAKRVKQGQAVERAVANATMEIPDPMVDDQVRRMVDDFARRIESQGISVEQYMQFTGMTADQMLAQMRPEALKRIQNSLVLEAIAKAEDIQISEERLDEEIAKMAAQYKMEVEKLKELMGDYEKEQMKNDLAIQAAVDMITDAAVEVEAKEEATKEAE
jgi:trigger factor